MSHFSSFRPLALRTVALAGAVAAQVAFTATLSAQQAAAGDLPSEGLVDRIVAVVGDSAILASQVDQRIRQLDAQGVEVPDDPAARRTLERDVLETLVNEQLLVQAAVEDTTIAVNESRVDEIVSTDIQERAREFGGETAMRQALRQQGLTMAGFREMLRTEARRQQLQNQYLQREQQQRGSSIPITDREMRQFYEDNRARFGSRPASVTFEQVVLRPRAADSARAAARQEAERLRAMLRRGEAEFEELARQHSDDPGTREQGGSLGWFRRGQMVRAFEDAVFSLREGEISDVVETRFGFHIIQVDRVRGAERRARHILITPGVTEDDVNSARVRAEDLKRRIENGASVDSLQAAIGSEEDPDSLTVPLDELQQLPSGYADVLRNASPGDVLGPIEWGPPDQRNVAVVKVTARREAGDFTFEDVRPQIRQRLQQEKLLERLFENLRERTYIDIRM